MIMGVAGPGAAGKGTLGKIILNNLGFSKIVNTTTRAQREGEQDGQDYYFVKEDDFTNTQQNGQFALSLERPGRGFYGITDSEIRAKLDGSSSGCLFEENPQNILELFANDSLDQPVDKVLLYVLPPQPIIETTMARLQKRLDNEIDPAKRILTPENFESTLGDRQIDEFLAIKDIQKNPTVQPIFLIMHNPEQGGQDIATILGKTQQSSVI